MNDFLLQAEAAWAIYAARCETYQQTTTPMLRELTAAAWKAGYIAALEAQAKAAA